jgi:hypothetical protein
MRRKDGSISGAVAVFRDTTEAKQLVEDLEVKNRDLSESEQAKTELVERLRLAIDEVSTPILELWDDVLALPVIGVVDSRRSVQIMERLLDEIVHRQSRFVIIDLTGVEFIDTRTADCFTKLIRRSSCSARAAGSRACARQWHERWSTSGSTSAPCGRRARWPPRCGTSCNGPASRIVRAVERAPSDGGRPGR